MVMSAEVGGTGLVGGGGGGFGCFSWYRVLSEV